MYAITHHKINTYPRGNINIALILTTCHWMNWWCFVLIIPSQWWHITWASRRLKSPANRLLVQYRVNDNNTENIVYRYNMTLRIHVYIFIMVRIKHIKQYFAWESLIFHVAKGFEDRGIIWKSTHYSDMTLASWRPKSLLTQWPVDSLTKGQSYNFVSENIFRLRITDHLCRCRHQL